MTKHQTRINLFLLLISITLLPACSTIDEIEVLDEQSHQTTELDPIPEDDTTKIRVILTSTSNWNNLVLWENDMIQDYKIIESWGEFIRFDIFEGGIAIDQEPLNAEKEMEIGVVVDFTILEEKIPVEVKFILEKSDINTAKVSVSRFEGQELIQLVEHEHDRSEYGVELNPFNFSVYLGTQFPVQKPLEMETAEGGFIFHNGQILTMDANNTLAEAIAVKDGVISAVGSNQDVLVLANQGYQVIDLENRTIMPAFIDTHTHIFNNNDQNYAVNQDLVLSNGIGTVGAMSVTKDEIEALQILDEEVGMKVRTNIYMTFITNCGKVLDEWYTEYPPSQDKSEMLRISGVKIFADGGSCNSPARSIPPYGDLYFSQNELNAILAKINEQGYQAAIHALGDRAVDQVLKAIGNANQQNPTDMRNRIEHTALVRDDMLGLHDQNGAIAIIFGDFPACYFGDDSSRFKGRTPKEYIHWEWRWRELIDANPKTVFAWHSDYQVFDMNPFVNLYGFVVRKEIAKDGSTCEPPDWAAANRISIEEALRVMTINSAYALFMEDLIGSLEPGKFADLILISENPLTIDHEEIDDIQVLMTMVSGNAEFCTVGFEEFCQ